MDSEFLQSKPSLIVEAISSQFFGNEISLLKLVDEVSGKELLLLDLILQSARKSDIEEVYICVPENSDRGKAIEQHVDYLQEKKKKRLGKLRLETLHFPSEISEADLLRRLDQGWGSILSKGFFWISGAVVPPADFNLLLETHKAAAKKDTAIVATFYPCQISPFSCTSIPNERSVIVADGKTNELMSYLRFDGYKETSLDFKSLIPLEGRWAIAPETLTVRSDLRLSGVYFGTSELLKVMRENFDYKTIGDMIDNALKGEVKMESVYIVTEHLKTFSKSQFASDVVPAGAHISCGRLLYEMLRCDALKDSDKIEDQGTRSSWKFHSESRTVHFETLKIGDVTGVVLESLLMENVELGKNVKISNCIISNSVRIGDGCQLKNVIVCPGVNEVPAQTALENGVLSRTPQQLEGYAKSDKPCGCGFFYQPWDLELFLSNEVPNTNWKQRVQQLENDPSRDPDRMFDELYANGGSESDSEEECDGEEEFKKEAEAMLTSVLGKADHVRNLILELRNFRLSANKSDLLVLQSILPVILTWIQQNLNLQQRESKKFEASALGEVMEAFSSADDPHAQCVILDACWREFGPTRVEDFVYCLYLLQPYMLQEDSLIEWCRSLKDNESRQSLEQNVTFSQYTKWLLEADNDEGSE